MKKALLVALGVFFARRFWRETINKVVRVVSSTSKNAKSDFRKRSISFLSTKRISALQQARSCVQQAQDHQALRGCKPEGHEHGGRHERGRDRDKN